MRQQCVRVQDLVFETSLSEDTILDATRRCACCISRRFMPLQLRVHHETCSRCICRQDLCAQVATVRLDRQQLTSLNTSAFTLLPSVRNLQLQHNALTRVPGNLADHLPRLRFLSLAHNRITSCDGCQRLCALMTLDVSYNAIVDLPHGHLPPTLRFLNVRNCLWPLSCMYACVPTLPMGTCYKAGRLFGLRASTRI